jgi:hypothetical protein
MPEAESAIGLSATSTPSAGTSRWWRPRDNEAAAATSAITVAAVNTIVSPWWNGAATSLGKNS